MYYQFGSCGGIKKYLGFGWWVGGLVGYFVKACGGSLKNKANFSFVSKLAGFCGRASMNLKIKCGLIVYVLYMSCIYVCYFMCARINQVYVEEARWHQYSRRWRWGSSSRIVGVHHLQMWPLRVGRSNKHTVPNSRMQVLAPWEKAHEENGGSKHLREVATYVCQPCPGQIPGVRCRTGPGQLHLQGGCMGSP